MNSEIKSITVENAKASPESGQRDWIKVSPQPSQVTASHPSVQDMSAYTINSLHEVTGVIES